MKKQAHAFSLVEVVVSLGVIAFAVIAILGVIPIGLSTGRSAQDETRAPQIAQDILGSLASQAQSKYPFETIYQPATGFSYFVDLSKSQSYKTMAADADGHLVAVGASSDLIKYPYAVIVQVDPSPPNFDQNYASQVTVRVISPPSFNPNNPPTPQQSVRDFVRIISKY